MEHWILDVIKTRQYEKRELDLFYYYWYASIYFLLIFLIRFHFSWSFMNLFCHYFKGKENKIRSCSVIHSTCTSVDKCSNFILRVTFLAFTSTLLYQTVGQLMRWHGAPAGHVLMGRIQMMSGAVKKNHAVELQSIIWTYSLCSWWSRTARVNKCHRSFEHVDIISVEWTVRGWSNAHRWDVNIWS